MCILCTEKYINDTCGGQSVTLHNIVFNVSFSEKLLKIVATRSEITHTNTQPFYGSVEFVRENPGEPVPEETFTHYSHRSHQSSLSAFSI